MPMFTLRCQSPAGVPIDIPIEAPTEQDAMVFAKSQGYRVCPSAPSDPDASPGYASEAALLAEIRGLRADIQAMTMGGSRPLFDKPFWKRLYREVQWGVFVALIGFGLLAVVGGFALVPIIIILGRGS